MKLSSLLFCLVLDNLPVWVENIGMSYITAEKILLVAVYTSMLFEGEGKQGKLVRQDRPYCCGNVIDLFATTIVFKEIMVGKNKAIVLEPYCPSCGRKVEASFQVLS